MNRVYVSDTSLIASPATEYVTEHTGDMGERDRRHWRMTPPISSIALALGNPLSTGLLTRESVLNPEGGAAVDLSQFKKPG